MQLTNNFSTGPSGTTITTANSGANGDDAWFAIGQTGTGSVVAYDLSPDRPTAEFVGKFLTVAHGTAVVAWVPGGSYTQIWTRFYAYFTVLPNNFASPSIFYVESSLGTQMATIAVNSSGLSEVIISNHDNSQTAITTGGITANQWFRIETHMTFSTTVGAIEMKWFDDADSDTPTETLSATGWNLGAASAVDFYYAYVIADQDLEALRMSGIELNNTGYPGPLPYHCSAVPGIQPSAIAVHTF